MSDIIEHKGFAVVVLGSCQAFQTVVYLSIAGTETATRAIWAALSEREEVDGKKLERGQKYKTIGQKVLGEHGPVFVRTLIHPNATILSTASPLYFIAPEGHEGPPPGFFERLNMAVKVPMLREWVDWLWEEGKETVETAYSYNENYYTQTDTPILRISATGVSVWSCKTRTELWHEVIRKHLGLTVDLMWDGGLGYNNGGSWAVKHENGVHRLYFGGALATFRHDKETKPVESDDLHTLKLMARAELGVALQIGRGWVDG